ncbi:MAG: hypothetical protein HY711_01495, partial [Candidatus Melainabacteria bacterium]|nr:hypothetical protein [Candidatus Melainabacteria bacterium]
MSIGLPEGTQLEIPICQACGVIIRGKAKFCTGCGTPISKASLTTLTGLNQACAPLVLSLEPDPLVLERAIVRCLYGAHTNGNGGGNGQSNAQEPPKPQPQATSVLGNILSGATRPISTNPSATVPEILSLMEDAAGPTTEESPATNYTPQAASSQAPPEPESSTEECLAASPAEQVTRQPRQPVETPPDQAPYPEPTASATSSQPYAGLGPVTPSSRLAGFLSPGFGSMTARQSSFLGNFAEPTTQPLSPDKDSQTPALMPGCIEEFGGGLHP